MSITTAQLLANLPPGDPRRQLVTGQVAAKPRAARHHGKAGVVKSEACAAIRRADAADVAFAVPVKTTNPVNGAQGRHWRVTAGKRKRERAVMFAAIAMRDCPPLPLVVTMTRVSPGVLDDDNLRPTLKTVRDVLAGWIGVDDRDPRVQWVYHQRRQPKTHAVEVVVNSIGSEQQNRKAEAS